MFVTVELKKGKVVIEKIDEGRLITNDLKRKINEEKSQKGKI